MGDTPSDAQRVKRRLELAHTLGFVAHPGNAAVLASRAWRKATGNTTRVEKPGNTLSQRAVSSWLSEAEALPADTFAFIDDHRRWVAAEHGQTVLHATDRRHAADQTVAERCVAVSLPEEDGRMLYLLAKQRKATHVIEMGTAFGVGTRYLAAGMRDGAESFSPREKVANEVSRMRADSGELELPPAGHPHPGPLPGGEGAKPQLRLWTIEADAERQRIACAQLNDLDTVVQPMPGTVEDRMPDVGAESQRFDLVFIDALHTFDATWGYYELIRRHSSGEVFCIFHDVNSSWEMARVWKKIVAQDATTEAASWQRLGLCIVRGALGDGDCEAQEGGA